MEFSELPPISDLTNNDWRNTLISSLYSTIEFLKGEINVKNEMINKLLNRFEQYEYVRNKSLSDVNDNYGNESISSEKSYNYELQKTYNERNIRPDEKFVTSRIKQILHRISKRDKDNTYDHDENNTVQSVVSLGDSILNNINPRGIFKDGNVKVKTFSGSISGGMKDHINPTILAQPDAIVIHIGSNDISKDIDTISNVQNIVSRKKKSSHTKIVLSSLLVRKDKKNIEEKVRAINVELKKFCEENLVEYLSHKNIDDSCLGKGSLHPNKKGKAYLAKNVINCINAMK